MSPEKGRYTKVLLHDPLHLSPDVEVQASIFALLTEFDGRTVSEIQAELFRAGAMVPTDLFEEVVRMLDEVHLLANENFKAYFDGLKEEFRKAPAIQASHAGIAYPADPEEARKWLRSFFEEAEGPGLPGPPRRNGLRGLIAPHMDLRVSGPCYAHGYKEVSEAEGADLFVILGTAHFGGRRLFTLTRKDYATPLGVAKTDAGFVEELSSAYGRDPFADEFLFRDEHSVEFQVVMLQAALDGRPFAIVPILVSSFHRYLEENAPPMEDPEVREFVEPLRKAVAARGGRAVLIAGVDFSHVGRKFGDEEAPTEESLQRLEEQDLDSLQKLARLAPDAYLEDIVKEDDARRIDATSSVYTLCQVLGNDGVEGRLLQYAQSPQPETGSVVTYASLGFYEPSKEQSP